MKLATIKENCNESAAIVTENGVIPIRAINRQLGKGWKENLFDIICSGELDEMSHWMRSAGGCKLRGLKSQEIPFESVKYAPLFRYPHTIWGIGLNYREHAADLSATPPSGFPGSFTKPHTTIIGNDDAIQIPTLSHKTTGEAELAVIIGRKCKNISKRNWISAVAGFTCAIDMTAEDILRQNPRFLTLAKSFDTFFSFGPHFVTPDEVPDVMNLNVATVINGKIHATNLISNMTFPPDHLVSFHSEVMMYLPGNIISTGTPGAVELKNGDVVECHIDGLMPLKNPVIDLKLKKREAHSG